MFFVSQSPALSTMFVLSASQQFWVDDDVLDPMDNYRFASQERLLDLIRRDSKEAEEVVDWLQKSGSEFLVSVDWMAVDGRIELNWCDCTVTFAEKSQAMIFKLAFVGV